jgi:2,4-dienoyl-CoA reductase (NADPH2)
VILATGGKAVNPQIPGIDKNIVVSQSKLHQQAKMPLYLLGPKILNRLTRLWMPIGQRVIIIGGAIHGVQLAEFLVERGRKVTIVETSAKFGGDMVVILAERLINYLKKKGVTMLGEVKFEEITEKGLTISTKDGKKQTIEADSIISALPLSANTELFKSIEGKFPEIYAIGDCHEPHRIIHAIQEGSSIGHKI